MRHYTIILLAALVVLLAGCDDVGSNTPSQEPQIFQLPFGNGNQYIEVIWPSGKPPDQPAGGRGRDTGKCFPVKDDSNLKTLAGWIAPTTTAVFGPKDNRTLYRIWVFISDYPEETPAFVRRGPNNTYYDQYGQGPFEHYVSVFVPQVSNDFVKMEREHRRVCVGQMMAGCDGRTCFDYWGELR